MSQKRLLIVLAHPDDEAFGSGGLIAKYVHEGVEVSYICATKGNRGTIEPEYLEKYGSIEAVRDAELECAAKVLGFKHLIKLGYGDSGMMGSADNEDPACLWQADENEVAGRIVEEIRRLKPQVILTHDPYGGYGHPDHIFVHRATLRAYLAAGDASQYPEAGAAYTPQKLYFTNLARALVRIGIWLMRLTGHNPRKMGSNKDIDVIEVLNHVPTAHASMNLRGWFEQWDEASRCHASQGGGRAFRFPGWWLVRRALLNRQTFTRHFPTPKPGEKLERDLFDRVKVD